MQIEEFGHYATSADPIYLNRRCIQQLKSTMHILYAFCNVDSNSRISNFSIG